MILNYLRSAVRNLRKSRFFSIINITGLTLGIAASLLMFNYYRFESGYDTFHEKGDRIYRVPMSITEKGQLPQHLAFTYPAVANAMKSEFAEIEEAVRFRRGNGLLILEETKIPNLQYFYVDQEVFNLFSFSFLHGNPTLALRDINNAVLTRKTALKLYGEENVLGKTFKLSGQVFQVSAVLDDIPVDSHIQFDLLLPYRKFVELVKPYGSDAENSWSWSDFYTYVLLKPGSEVKALESKLPSFIHRHKGEDMKAQGNEVALTLQPLADIHDRSGYDYELPGNGNYTYLNYIAVASFFILFMAWLNYVNLSTSRSLERAKEVGVRKSVGAARFNLINQFLIESIVTNLIAIAMGVVLMVIVNPVVSNLIAKQLMVPKWTDLQFWGPIGIFLIVGSLASGFYPAFVLSSFKPSSALKRLDDQTGSKGTLRKVLVVVQVCLAGILISGTLGLLQQIQFMRNRELGIDIDQTLVLKEHISRDSTWKPVVNSFFNALEQHALVKSVSASGDIPGGEISGSSFFNVMHSSNSKVCRIFEVDENFLNNYQFTVLAGRTFSKDFSNDRNSVILNETAMKIFGFENAETAIDQAIESNGEPFKIIGVVKDYHQKSLHHSFDPTVFIVDQSQWIYYSIKMDGRDAAATVNLAQTTWKKFFPESPFEYFFLDEHFNAQYRSESTITVLISSFAVLGITIACLGLLGLTSFAVAKRTKEIGVRKILGASTTSLTILLTREYMWLVSIALLIAIPVTQYLMNIWLQDYAFKVPLGLLFFVLPVCVIMTITLSTVGFHVFRAASSNPVKSLRSE